MELRQLQHFLSVIDTGNFHRAAEQVNLTQQAVSKSIRQLETKLGVRLLDRDRQYVVPTEFGRLLVPHARTIDAEIRQFTKGLNTALGSHKSLVRLGATPTSLKYLVPEALRRLLAKHGYLQFHIAREGFDSLSVDLLRGDLDLVVSTDPSEKPDSLIQIESLVPDSNLIVARSGHPLATKTDLTIADLKSYPWVTITNFEKAQNDLRKLFASIDAKPPTPMIVSSSIDFAIDWIAGNDFLTILPGRLVEHELASNRLTALDFESEQDPWSIILAYRRNSTRSPATLALIEELKMVGADMTKNDPSPIKIGRA